MSTKELEELFDKRVKRVLVDLDSGEVVADADPSLRTAQGGQGR